MALSSPPEFKHFLYCPFTGLGLHNGYRGDAWLVNRIKIFKQFVIPSLLNQTSQNFVLWISWRFEEFDNPIVDELGEYLTQIRGLKFLFTFGGLCFWDDKYEDKVAKKRLQYNLEQTLPLLKDIVGKAKNVLMTIQPSDDMYLSEAVADIREEKTSYGYSQGYIINYATKELAEYNPETYPPFFTLKFTREEFFDPHTPKFYYKSHEEQPVYKHSSQRMFCVGTHGENISTVFNHPYKGRTITGIEKEEILIKLGIWQQAPMKVGKTGLRLLSRKVLNRLPFQKQLREIYHKSPWQYF